MASSKTKTIDEIDDLPNMFQAMVALGISCEGCKTLEEMKDRVKTTMNQSSNIPSWTAGQAFSVLSKVKDEDTKKREVLAKFYCAVEKCYDELDDKIRNLLQRNMGNVKEKMKNHKTQLKQKEYYLLVAGETGSGKSSLVNLILGEELLPYSVLSTTSTICELRYGSERRIVAHFKDKDPVTGLATKAFSLAEPPAGASEQSYIQQISPYVHLKSDREKGSVYKKVELFWPHQLLKNGVVIIDSPGVGESEIMDEIVSQYLPQAFAFIYVINSANAGGVQKDRLQKLMEDVLEKRKEEEFPSNCALFVCNKWDQVPDKEENDVKNHVVRKLKMCWPGLVPEMQIVYMSTKHAWDAQKYGIITKEFFSLMSFMRSMVLKSITARLEIYWKWLDGLLSQIIRHATAYVKNASRDQVKVIKIMSFILARLARIELKQNEVMEDLHNYLKHRTGGAVKNLSDYLRSDGVRSRFTSWTLDEVPKAETSWEVTKSNITKVLGSRLQDIIEHWEEDNHVFADARESLLKRFQQQYNFVEGELRNLQGAVTSDEILPEQDHSGGEGFTMTEKVAIGVTSPIWVPLTLVALVIGAPVVGVMAIKSKLEDRSRIRKYEKDKCAFMSEASAEFLDDATNEAVLKSFVKDQLKDAKLCLRQIEARIPELIQADKLLCKQLMAETRSTKEIKEVYQPMLDKASDIRGHFAVFGLKEVRADGISSEKLDLKDMSFLLGRGAFASVYQGKMKTENAVEQTVALKVCNESLSVGNASLIANEVELLRKLQNPNIVHFYGTSLLNKDGSTRVILVMEYCQGNLKEHIFNNPEIVPAKSTNAAAARETSRWTTQITAALSFIHGQGVVHRDLKLDNILLSQTNSAKITDVGVSKVADDITGTLAGTPVYMAPEVFHGQIYDSKADIYSLGIIFWELWYGQQAFGELQGKNLVDFLELVDSGRRPQDVKGCRNPKRRWRVLMENCWKKNPEERPPAAWCYKETVNLYKETVKQL